MYLLIYLSYFYANCLKILNNAELFYRDYIKLFVDYIPPIDAAGAELTESDIMCFTDSEKYLIEIVTIEADFDDSIYTITPTSNGYYWCTHSNSKTFLSSESNKVLYIDKSSDGQNLYAVKIKTLIKPYTMNENVIKNVVDEDIWPKLQEYVYFNDEYSKKRKETGFYGNVTVMNFK